MIFERITKPGLGAPVGRFVTHGRESARAVGVHKAWLMGTIETFRGPDQASCAPLALMTNFASAD